MRTYVNLFIASLITYIIQYTYICLSLNKTTTVHPCQSIYNLSSRPSYGDTSGICRITGLKSTGIPFSKWIKKTFTDIGCLHPGTIISNEAAFCFDESSEELRIMASKDKPQRFRNYSHFVFNNEWHIYNKSEKHDILHLMLEVPDICVIAESGQKHLVFKHTPGTWQLEEQIITPDVLTFAKIHERVRVMSDVFSNGEIQSGRYSQHRIRSFGIQRWKQIEDVLEKYRGSAIFDLAIFFSKIKYDYGKIKS